MSGTIESAFVVPTGPTGHNFKTVNILSTGPTGLHGLYKTVVQLTGPTGASGPTGTFKTFIDAGATGVKGLETIIITGYSRSGGGGATSTFDPATIANGVLSNGNLTYTHNAVTTQDGARTTTNHTAGKYYLEITLTSMLASGGNTGVSFGDTTATYANQGSGLGSHGIIEYLNTGDIYANGTKVGSGNGAGRAPATGDVIGMTIDVTNKQVWFQNITTGAAQQGPFTPTSEANYQAMLVTNTSGGVYTINTGGSAFVGALPSGAVAWG